MCPKSIPNNFRIENDVAYIELTRHDGIVRAEAIIDVEDLDRVLAYRRWHATWNTYTKSFYCAANYPKTMLHRFVMDAPEGKEVDHKSHDTLDCRKENLRACDHAQNQQNRRHQVHGKSGIRNVVWSSEKQKWRVGIQANGKYHSFGYFKNLEDAAIVAERERKRLHGEFAT